MSDNDPSEVDFATARYPSADITPAEFEDWVVQLFKSAAPLADNLVVTPHDTVRGTDGAYDFDATVRYRLAGMAFLVVVEAKRHRNPVKRELVQVLHQKVMSVGAHKGVMISTAPYQRGALDFAKTHGISLVKITEGRFTYEVRARDSVPPLSREEAAQRFGLPTFVAHQYQRGDEPGTTRVTLISPEYPEYVAEGLLGRPTAG